MSKPTYQSLDQRSHILHRPDMYIGTVKETMTDFFAASVSFDEEKQESITIAKRTGTINPGLHRIFIEILSNAIDNVWRSIATDTKSTKIKVDITDAGEITVWNDGLTIPVEIDDATGLYNPELVFGRLLTSSNYDDQEERMTSGRNGLGAKATSVFSREFTVKLFDPTTGKQYVQTWRNNMADRERHKITSPKTKNGYTQITFLPDYVRFGVDGLSADMRSLFYKNIVDTAMITGIAVYYNDVKIPVKTLKDYAALYSTTDMINITTADSDVVLAAHDGSFEAISFVNGIETFHGGVHVDAWAEALLRPVLEKINSAVKKGSTPLVMKDIRPYFRLFLNCKLANPAFTSQEKSKLVSPAVRPEVTARHITAILKWPVMESIRDILKNRELLALKKTEKRRGFVKIDGLDPANLAGGKQSMDCSLILCEGDSAKTFAVKGIQTGVYGRNGRDYFGIYPLKGKCLNVRNSNVTTISKNKEISDVIQALNMKYGADYSEQENYHALSYGRVIILTDSDVDGYHICGLLLNFFHKLFPTLLEQNPSFITCMRTPIVRLYQGKTNLAFYTLEEFRAYQLAYPEKRGDAKYFKGLGTNNDKEIEASFGRKMIEFQQDQHTDANMDKVFHSKFSDQRKEWLEQYDPSSEREIVSPDPVQKLAISDFLDYEMIKFSIDDCKRSIPHLIDGLKESHRKILYATILKNLRASGKTMKVAQLAGFVAEHTNYHHGEQCLFDTITKLAHDFVGSNNIPLLYRDGQFGSRNLGGKDAANARYIFTKMDVLTRLLFRPEDDALLTHILDDGDKVEPVFFVPILPMILINGCTAGIGTGWSSQVPCYHPLELSKCVKAWLNRGDGFTFPAIQPWYRGFKGTIERVSATKYVTRGIISKKKGKANVCVVSELPIGLWTDRFKESVEDLVEAKHVRGYRNYSTNEAVHFELDESKDGMECTLDNIKLSTSLSCNNMVLFSDKGIITKYDGVEQILESFCEVRYRYYVLRKAALLAELQRKLMVVRNRMRFLREVMKGDLVVQEVDEEALRKELDRRGYEKIVNDEKIEESETLKPYSYLVNMNIRSFTRQKVEGLQKEITGLETDYTRTESTSPTKMWQNDLDEFEAEYAKQYK